MPDESESILSRQISTVRHFNRFYTRAIGTLQSHLLGSPFTLAEARVLYELFHSQHSTATQIARELNMDAGYLSRILAIFATKKLIVREDSSSDARLSIIKLTKSGKKAFAALNENAAAQVSSLLQPLGAADREKLVRAMTTIEILLTNETAEAATATPIVLRPHRPGDMGWVVQRHGALYAQEYGWDERFEALTARIVADFIDHFDARRERCWIAERNDEPAGCVFLVKHPELPETVAKLRLLLVEPRARGFGIGRRLVKECTFFARAAGYRKIQLWTNSVLDAARHLYQEAGYQRIKQEPHHSFGKDLIGETWELTL